MHIAHIVVAAAAAVAAADACGQNANNIAKYQRQERFAPHNYNYAYMYAVFACPSRLIIRAAHAEKNNRLRIYCSEHVERLSGSITAAPSIATRASCACVVRHKKWEANIWGVGLVLVSVQFNLASNLVHSASRRRKLILSGLIKRVNVIA